MMSQEVIADSESGRDNARVFNQGKSEPYLSSRLDDSSKLLSIAQLYRAMETINAYSYPFPAILTGSAAASALVYSSLRPNAMRCFVMLKHLQMPIDLVLSFSLLLLLAHGV
jgi:hypothetical protein